MKEFENVSDEELKKMSLEKHKNGKFTTLANRAQAERKRRSDYGAPCPSYEEMLDIEQGWRKNPTSKITVMRKF